MGDPWLIFQMPTLKPMVQALIFAAVAPWLYDRYTAFSPMVVSRPGSFQNMQTFISHEVKYRDRLRNCEDVIMVESLSVAFLSCDPGRDRWNTVMGTFRPEDPSIDNAGIYIYDYATSGLDDTARLKQLTIDEPDLHPLGLAFDASTSTLYVVNHARQRGSHILILHVDTSAFTSTLVARLKHPLLHTPNSVEVIGKYELYVTNDHYIRAAISPLLSKIETFSGAPGGTVVYIDTRFPENAKVVARVPFANGVAFVNSTTLAVASSSKSGLYLYNVKEDHSLSLKEVVRTPAAVDNLSVDDESKVLMAGHPFAPALIKVSESRATCNPHGSAGERESCKYTAPSWVAEWSAQDGLTDLYKNNGQGFSSSSTAVRDNNRGVGIISGLYESGILIFKI
ncbi:calcium-dependent phosphotriesterase [Didymella exigua CBS 183.55]|uniref:Calcium-dependent phosphotriesterase n=1 Tax=Didymella exigua CBS 183.55 TaxID=1150837 RepID=A0A6A5S2U0_9PLEO|nr:calcium-dependent phosphotriesterase [Didymella exigua CBS 183.55]KAF1933940.1 calcium-dependent phosphotriesterase [Didymella exigua CBS 183.55]